MKPGNLIFIKVPNPAARRKMRIRYRRTSNLRCAVFYFFNLKGNENGKKTFYL